MTTNLRARGYFKAGTKDYAAQPLSPIVSLHVLVI